MRTKYYLPLYGGISLDVDVPTGIGTIESTLGRELGPAGHALESLILGHACAGIDVESPAYMEGVETAVEAVSNHLGI